MINYTILIIIVSSLLGLIILLATAHLQNKYDSLEDEMRESSLKLSTWTNFQVDKNAQLSNHSHPILVKYIDYMGERIQELEKRISKLEENK